MVEGLRGSDGADRRKVADSGAQAALRAAD
jgi:hypothetical protein